MEAPQKTAPTDDIEGLLNDDCVCEALGNDVYLSNDRMEIAIINTTINYNDNEFVIYDEYGVSKLDFDALDGALDVD